MADHPVRDDIDFVSGEFWGREPARGAGLDAGQRARLLGRAGLGRRALRRRAAPSRRIPTTFSNAGGIRPDSGPIPMMIDMDDPEHWRRRKLVNRGFTPRRVRESEDEIRAVCDEIIDARLRAGRVRLRVGHRRAAAADHDRRRARRRARGPQDAARVVRRHDVRAHRRPRRRRARRPTRSSATRTYATRLIADRRAEPARRPDERARARRGRRRPARRRLARPRVAAHPHRRRRDDPPRDHRRRVPAAHRPRPVGRGCAPTRDTLPTAVEEMLRWVSPIKNMARTATRDVELSGQQIDEGEKLLLLYPSANRDEDVFADPFTLRHHPHAERARRLRLRHPLLPRQQPRPARAHASCSSGCSRACPTSSWSTPTEPALPPGQLRQRLRVDAGPLHPRPRSKSAR